jgi:hypothetical protein
LQDAAHKAARTYRPRLHRQCSAGRPFAAHTDAEQRAEQEEIGESRREAGREIAQRIPQDRDHQRDLAPDPVGEPALERRDVLDGKQAQPGAAGGADFHSNCHAAPYRSCDSAHFDDHQLHDDLQFAGGQLSNSLSYPRRVVWNSVVCLRSAPSSAIIRTSEHFHVFSPPPRLSVRMFGSGGKKRANASSNCAAL